jgi:hypothetical protein
VDQIVNHEAFSHCMFRGRIIAARAVAHSPVFKSPVIITRNELIKDAESVKPGREGVVVDYIQNNPESQAMQRLHCRFFPFCFPFRQDVTLSCVDRANSVVEEQATAFWANL